jgi:hypothetical protein
MWIIIKIFFSFICLSSAAFAVTQSVMSSPWEEEESLQFVSKNKSIMTCGDESSPFFVYSELSIQAILSISNVLSGDQVPLETQWDSFAPLDESHSFVTLKEQEFSKYPKDVQRILYYCLAWDESSKFKLFTIPQEAVDNIAVRIKIQRPWKVLSKEVAQRIDHLSDQKIRNFVYLILRSNVFHSVRGDFKQNQTFWSIPFSWKN